MSAAQGPSASTPLSATLSNGTEGSVYSSLMLLEAISRDATCSLHQVVKKCEWETNKGAIIAIVCVCVCVLIPPLSVTVYVHPAAEEEGCSDAL